jgi:hypothetical protein
VSCRLNTRDAYIHAPAFFASRIRLALSLIAIQIASRSVTTEPWSNMMIAYTVLPYLIVGMTSALLATQLQLKTRCLYLTPKVNHHRSQAMACFRQWNLQEAREDLVTTHLSWPAKHQVENSRRPTKVKFFIESLICLFLLDTAFLGFGCEAPRVAAESWLSTIVVTFSPARYAIDWASLEFGMTIFWSIIATSLGSLRGTLVTIVIIDHLPRKAWIKLSFFALASSLVFFEPWPILFTIIILKSVSTLSAAM